MQNDLRTAHLQIHLCVLLWGFTAILGKLITLDALPLVWWRMLIVVVLLALVPAVWRGLRQLDGKQLAGYSLIGALVALHWLTFYGAVKLANASVAATCIALAPAFTAVVEPWLAKRPFRTRELVMGIAVLPGVALVVGGVPEGMRLGVVVGAVSAFLVAVFGSLNKRMAGQTDAFTVTALELGAGTLTLTLLAPLLPLVLPAMGSTDWVVPGLHDAGLLLVLSVVCTLLPFALSLMALRHLSAYTMQLVTNLEPVYAVALAMLLLGEQRELTPAFYAGVTLILAVVFFDPVRNFLQRRHAGH